MACRNKARAEAAVYDIRRVRAPCRPQKGIVSHIESPVPARWEVRGSGLLHVGNNQEDTFPQLQNEFVNGNMSWESGSVPHSGALGGECPGVPFAHYQPSFLAPLHPLLVHHSPVHLHALLPPTVIGATLPACHFPDGAGWLVKAARRATAMAARNTGVHVPHPCPSPVALGSVCSCKHR